MQDTPEKPEDNPDTEKSTLGKRVKRYASVTGKSAGFGAKMAGKRLLGIEIDNARDAESLKKALGGLKGPLMKVAQILATVPGALPAEYTQELMQLQNQAPSMSWVFVKRRMSGELGPDWQTKFDNFEREAAHAASLGQVHIAHKDGQKHNQKLACKLQYPDMASAIEADLKQLKFILKMYRQYDNSIDTSNVYDELKDRLHEELDYKLEARHMALYRHMMRDEPTVHIPDVLPDLSTNRLLTMTWLTGDKILNFKDAPLEVRNQIALNMFRCWYVPFYEYGVIHGDPHLGNYTIRDDHSINLLDFGCVRVFKPSLVKGVIDLYFALREQDEAKAVAAYESWGFTGLSKEQIEILNTWAQFVYAPLMEDKKQRMEETNSGDYGREKAAEVHAALKKAGTVRPPREFVLIDRAALGLGSVFLHLQAEVNWYQLFHALIQDFDVKKLATKQAKALDVAGLSG